MIETCELYGYWHSCWYIYRWHLAGGVLGLFLLVAVVYIGWRFFSNKLNARPDLCSQTIFLLSDKQLAGYLKDPKSAAFYISEVLKKYIKTNFNCDVSGLTDGEMVVALERNGLSEERCAELKEILNFAIAAKFGVVATLNDVKKMQHLAVLWVKTHHTS